MNACPGKYGFSRFLRAYHLFAYIYVVKLATLVDTGYIALTCEIDVGLRSRKCTLFTKARHLKRHKRFVKVRRAIVG